MVVAGEAPVPNPSHNQDEMKALHQSLSLTREGTAQRVPHERAIEGSIRGNYITFRESKV